MADKIIHEKNFFASILLQGKIKGDCLTQSLFCPNTLNAGTNNAIRGQIKGVWGIADGL